MGRTVTPTNQGVDAILSIDGVVLGGQKTAILNRTMSPINITNQINNDWQKNIAGTRAWSLTCGGMFIKGQEAFDALEKAFYDGKEVTVTLTDNDRTYTGQAIITSFPVTANYNDAFMYSLIFLGTGPLE